MIHGIYRIRDLVYILIKYYKLIKEIRIRINKVMMLIASLFSMISLTNRSLVYYFKNF